MLRFLTMCMAILMLALVTSPAPGQATPVTVPPPAATVGAPAGNAALQYWLAFAMLPDKDSPLHALVSEWKTAPLGPAADDLEGSAALHLLHLGAAMPNCDWGIDYRDGPATLLPHLGKARELARLGCLRARWHFEHGRPAAALSDVRAVLVLARHVESGGGVLITHLVQIAIEETGIDLLASHFAALRPEDLATVEKDLAALPPAGAIKDTLAFEARWSRDWLEKVAREPDAEKRAALVAAAGANDPDIRAVVRDPVQFTQALEQLGQFRAELVRICDLPADQEPAATAALARRVEAASAKNPLAATWVPALTNARASEARTQIHRAMLRAALAYRHGGAAALAHVPDPVTGQPFTLRDLPERFELASAYRYKDQPVSLGFSKSAPTPAAP